MARNAIPVSSASISSFKLQKSKPPNYRTQTAPCPECGKSYALFSEGVYGWNTQPHKLCIDCYRSHCQKHRHPKINNDTGNRDWDKSGVGGTFTQISTISSVVHDVSSTLLTPPFVPPVVNVEPANKHCNMQTAGVTCHLNHSIFSKGQWCKSQFLNHPKVQLQLSVVASDYRAFHHHCPTITPKHITALADSGAQTYLWSMNDFLAAGFQKSDLLPVSVDLVAANTIEGAILLRLQGKSPDGTKHSCRTMVCQQTGLWFLLIHGSNDGPTHYLTYVSNCWCCIHPTSCMFSSTASGYFSYTQCRLLSTAYRGCFSMFLPYTE